MYQSYITASEYVEMGYSTIPVEYLDKYLKKASRQIDTLTFNRIVKRGFNNLTEFQQEIIKEVCAEQASFIYENEDAIESVLSSYTINGVSMTWGGGMNVIIEGGVPTQKTLYSLLEQTGLCCRLSR